MHLTFFHRRQNVRERFKDRGLQLFRNSERQIKSDFDTLIGNQAAKGALQSGSTIKSALRTFEQSASTTLTQLTSEAANQIEHHGAQWRSALEGIGAALSSHLYRAEHLLTWPVALANNPDSDSTKEAIDAELERISETLAAQLADFRDGWTAPKPAKWKDRNPVSYALAMAAAGAVVTQAIRMLAT